MECLNLFFKNDFRFLWNVINIWNIFIIYILVLFLEYEYLNEILLKKIKRSDIF